jgi:hypothetical protein
VANVLARGAEKMTLHESFVRAAGLAPTAESERTLAA